MLLASGSRLWPFLWYLEHLVLFASRNYKYLFVLKLWNSQRDNVPFFFKRILVKILFPSNEQLFAYERVLTVPPPHSFLALAFFTFYIFDKDKIDTRCFTVWKQTDHLILIFSNIYCASTLTLTRVAMKFSFLDQCLEQLRNKQVSCSFWLLESSVIKR